MDALIASDDKRLNDFDVVNQEDIKNKLEEDNDLVIEDKNGEVTEIEDDEYYVVPDKESNDAKYYVGKKKGKIYRINRRIKADIKYRDYCPPVSDPNYVPIDVPDEYKEYYNEILDSWDNAYSLFFHVGFYKEKLGKNSLIYMVRYEALQEEVSEVFANVDVLDFAHIFDDYINSFSEDDSSLENIEVLIEFVDKITELLDISSIDINDAIRLMCIMNNMTEAELRDSELNFIFNLNPDNWIWEFAAVVGLEFENMSGVREELISIRNEILNSNEETRDYNDYLENIHNFLSLIIMSKSYGDMSFDKLPTIIQDYDENGKLIGCPRYISIEDNGLEDDLEIDGYTLATDEDFVFIPLRYAPHVYNVSCYFNNDSHRIVKRRGLWIYTGNAEKVIVPNKIQDNVLQDYVGMFAFRNMTKNKIENMIYDIANSANVELKIGAVIDESLPIEVNIQKVYARLSENLNDDAKRALNVLLELISKSESYISSFNNDSPIKGVASNNPYITSTMGMFATMNTDELELRYLDTKNVTDMTGMFAFSNIDEIKFGTGTLHDTFNTTEAKSMIGMFCHMNKEREYNTLNLKDFKMSDNHDTRWMFYGSENIVLYANQKNNLKYFKDSKYRPSSMIFSD